MRSEREIKELEEEISRLTGFIGDFGAEKEFENEDVKFSCNVSDALSWVLEEISTKYFRSEAYLNISSIRKIVKNVEKRTGKKFEEYV